MSGILWQMCYRADQLVVAEPVSGPSVPWAPRLRWLVPTWKPRIGQWVKADLMGIFQGMTPRNSFRGQGIGVWTHGSSVPSRGLALEIWRCLSIRSIGL